VSYANTTGAPILRFQRRSSSGPPKQDPGWAGLGKLLLQFFFLFFIISFWKRFKNSIRTNLKVEQILSWNKIRIWHIMNLKKKIWKNFKIQSTNYKFVPIFEICSNFEIGTNFKIGTNFENWKQNSKIRKLEQNSKLEQISKIGFF
jgi:hypothetical protein